MAPDQVDDAVAAARIRPRPAPALDGRLVIDVDPGSAARIGSIEVRGVRGVESPPGGPSS